MLIRIFAGTRRLATFEYRGSEEGAKRWLDRHMTLYHFYARGLITRPGESKPFYASTTEAFQ